MNHAFYGRGMRIVSAFEFCHLLPMVLYFSKHQCPYPYNRNANSGYLKSSCIMRTNVCKITGSQFSVQQMNAKVVVIAATGLPFVESHGDTTSPLRRSMS